MISLNQQVAEALGWKLKDSPSLPGLYALLFNPAGVQVGTMKKGSDGTLLLVSGEVWPNWSGDLHEAWYLQKDHPIEGVVLFNVTWLQLTPERAALAMTLKWLEWKLKQNPKPKYPEAPDADFLDRSAWDE